MVQATLSDRLWRSLRQGHIAVAAAETSNYRPDLSIDDVLIWAHVIAATPEDGTRRLRDFARAVAGIDTMRLRGLNVVLGLHRAIAAGDWPVAARHVQTIRYHAPGTSRTSLVWLLTDLAANSENLTANRDQMVSRLSELLPSPRRNED